MPLLTKMNIDENYSLDILKMTTSTNELVKKFVNRKLLILERFQVDVENIKKKKFNDGRSMNLCFLQLDSLPIKS
jgi:hypothetical protein